MYIYVFVSEYKKTLNILMHQIPCKKKHQHTLVLSVYICLTTFALVDLNFVDIWSINPGGTKEDLYPELWRLCVLYCRLSHPSCVWNLLVIKARVVQMPCYKLVVRMCKCRAQFPTFACVAVNTMWLGWVNLF